MAEQHLVHQNGDRLFVTSLDISNRFGKRHDDVLKAVRNLDCSPEFGRRNFAESSYNNSQNKAQPLFEITRDGFVFLCMGFTGPQAALWKERYITAFNEMEAALRGPGNLPEVATAQFFMQSNKLLAHEVGQLKDTVAAQNQAIMALYQRIDSAQRGHIRAVTSLLSLQKRQSVENAKRLVIELAAAGHSRQEIARRSGKTLNYIRQILFQERHDSAAAQSEPSRGEAA